MKKVLLAALILLAAGFTTITYFKEKSRSAEEVQDEGAALSAEEKARILRFWEVYREGVRLHRQGEWARAEAAYHEALALDPAHWDALYNLGNVMFEQDRYQEAIASWRRLAEVNPVSARAHLQLGAIHSCGVEGTPFNLDIAETAFRRALAINKEETRPVLSLGEVALLKGDATTAREFFATVLSTNSKSVAARYLTGYVMWKSGDATAALESLRQAVALSGDRKYGDSASGEGDTRSGTGPMLTGSAERMSFFAPSWMALASRDGNDISPQQMQDEYNALERRLERLADGRRP